jgi:hypothetical protein
MHSHRHHIVGQISRVLLSVFLLACWPSLDWADSTATQGTSKPKVTLDAGTQTDADAAIAVMEKFLGLWDERKYEEASKLVAEPVRKLFVENMPKRDIEFKSVDDIHLFKRDEILLARVHASLAPSPERKDLKKQEIGMDMVYRDGKWWVTAR